MSAIHIKDILLFPFYQQVQPHLANELLAKIFGLLLLKIALESAKTVKNIASSLENRELTLSEKSKQVALLSANIATVIFLGGNQIAILTNGNCVTRIVLLQSLMMVPLQEKGPDTFSVMSATGDSLLARDQTLAGYSLKAIAFVGSNLETIQGTISRTTAAVLKYFNF